MENKSRDPLIDQALRIKGGYEKLADHIGYRERTIRRVVRGEIEMSDKLRGCLERVVREGQSIAPAMIRIARRAMNGHESLTIAERILLLDDVSLILPKAEAEAASASAYALRAAMSFQQELFTLLK